MTSTSQSNPTTPQTAVAAGVAQFGEVRDIPLNRLKASPNNVRRVGHRPEAIESRAATIGVKGVLQPPVVEPEIKNGKETGYFLVTAGEGRRQALRLLAKRKALSRAVLVRCIVDTINDPAEVSLDENISQETMHPADQYEAFKDLAERKGYGPEEIAARFGVKPGIVRQRLRLGMVAPALLDLYREAVLTLDQITAFAVNPDPDRQVAVYTHLPAHDQSPRTIRRLMTEHKVATSDRRVRFVGLEAYVAAGGPVLSDLFFDIDGGWIEDAGLLDRLVNDKLAALAQDIRDREGWKWASAHLDYPYGHGCSRIFEHALARPPEVIEAINSLQAEAAALTEQWADIEPPPPEVAARLEAIEAELEGFGDDYGHTPEEKARAGVMVILGEQVGGAPRVERGFVRPQDEPVPDPQDEADDGEGQTADASDAPEDGAPEGSGEDKQASDAEEPVGDPAAPLPDRVIAELTAHRSAALRDALAQNPDLAQVALVHVLVSRVFAMGYPATCLDIRWGSRNLNDFGDGIEDSPAGLAIAERHRLWGRQVPGTPEDIWDFVVGLDGDSRASLLAHCVSLTLDGVRSWVRRPKTELAHVETLASALDLDMRAYWAPTATHYLDRVTKAQIMAAVTEGVSAEAAARLSGLKKPDMVAAAEPLLVHAGWLPAVLRTAGARPAESAAEAGEGAATAKADPVEREDEEAAPFEPGSEGQDEAPLCDLDAVLLDAVALSAEDEAQVAALLTAAE